MHHARRPSSAAFFLGCGLVATLLCSIVSGTLLGPSVARACSAGVPVRHHVRFGTNAVLANADPNGHVAALDDPSFAHVEAALTADGRTLVLAREDYSDEDLAAGCLATFVDVVRVDLTTGTATRLRRIRDIALQRLTLSADDRHLLVQTSEETHLFSLETNRRVRVFDELTVDFVGTDALLASDRLVDLASDRTLATLPLDPNRRVLPGFGDRDAFRVIVDREGAPSRIFEATRSGRRVVLRHVRMPLRGRVVASSADGTRVLALVGADARVYEVPTGRELLHRRAAHRFTTGALSADGRSVALVQHARPDPREAAESAYPLEAFQPTTVERVDVESGVAVAWSSPAP